MKYLCKYCGLEDGACVCRHLPTEAEQRDRLNARFKDRPAKPIHPDDIAPPHLD